MAVKMAYEPKDARITFDEKYYSDDIDQIKREPRKRITGTQALVEFLNTTSPEEFQKVPKRSSALFFRRKSTNNNKAPMMTTNTTNSPTTIHRKNYIEIIANPFTFNKTKSSSSTPSTAKNNSVAIIGSQLNRTLSKSTSIYSLHLEKNKPVLPMRKKGFGTTSGTQTGTTNTTRRQPPSLRVSTIINNHNDYHAVNSIVISTTLDEDDDIIEGGLKQRLNHYQSLSIDKPSDSISKSLAHEHMAALEVVSSMMIDEQQEENKNKMKKKSRHIQVQTMPYPNDDNALKEQKQEEVTVVTATFKLVNDNVELQQKLNQVEKELKQEKLISSRLQAALEETHDQFEALSGLAYKKLREIWEEKTRWENACIEAKEKCWHDHQQQILGRHADDDNDNDSCLFIDGTVMDFLVDEDMDNNQEDEGEEEEEYLI